MARKIITKMAYKDGEEMMFGTAKHPVTTKRGIEIGGGYVHPEVVPHPRPGSEKTMKTLLREYERANGDALERMTIVGHPTLVVENEHVFQMTHNPKWGGEIAAQPPTRWTITLPNTASRQPIAPPLPTCANRIWSTCATAIIPVKSLSPS